MRNHAKLIWVFRNWARSFVRLFILFLSLCFSYASLALAQASDSFYVAENEGRITEFDTTFVNSNELATEPQTQADCFIDSSSGYIYWSTASQAMSVQRAKLDGSSLETVFVDNSLGPVPTGFILNDSLYTTGQLGTRIYKRNVDGSNPQLLLNVGNLTDLDVDAANAKMYYSLATSIRRANLDGTAPTILVAGLSNVRQLALDLPRGKIYWVDQTTDKLQRANLDGTNVEDILTGLVDPTAIAIDSIQQKLYWAESGIGVVRRANLDGSSPEDIASLPGLANSVAGLCIDFVGSRIYWTRSGERLIQSTTLAGEDLTDVVSSMIDNPYSVAIDRLSGQFYLATGQLFVNPGRIIRRDITGGSTELVVDGLIEPRSLRLDVRRQVLYWRDETAGKIQRASTDSGVVEDLVVAGAGELFGLDIDPINEHIYFTNTSTDKIIRANLDGSNLTDIHTLANVNPRHVALNFSNSKLYWVNNANPPTIMRSNFDGSVSEVVSVRANNIIPRELTFDTATNKLVWIENSGLFNNNVMQANLDGSNVVVLKILPQRNFDGLQFLSSETPSSPLIAGLSQRENISGSETLSGTTEAYNLVRVFSGSTLLGSTLADSAGNWSFSTPSLPPGNYALQAYATNIVGNTSSISNSIALSIEPALLGSAYFMWNGALDLLNVLSVVNTSNTNPVTLSAQMRDASGAEISQTSFTIPASGAFDIIVNDLPGFDASSYGLLKLNFQQNSVEAQAMYYRYAPDRDTEIQMGAPLQMPLSGESFVAFNTIRPSEEIEQVFNWLSIANPGSSASVFTVEVYDAVGTLLTAFTTTLAAGERQDYPAGQQFAGEQVGIFRIRPQDNSAPYLAQLSRFGALEAPEPTGPSFGFGMLVPARAAESSSASVPLSTGAGGQNWLVLANPSSTLSRVQVDVYENSSGLQDSTVFALNAYSQLHIYANQYFGTAESGMAVITAVNGSFIADSTFYFHDSTETLTDAYASDAREVFGLASSAPYNTFLDQFEFVKLFNLLTVNETITLTVYSQDGTSLGSNNLTLAAKTGLELSLHDLPFAPPSDSIGRFTIETSQIGSTVGEILRLTPRNGYVTAAESIPLR